MGASRCSFDLYVHRHSAGNWSVLSSFFYYRYDYEVEIDVDDDSEAVAFDVATGNLESEELTSVLLEANLPPEDAVADIAVTSTTLSSIRSSACTPNSTSPSSQKRAIRLAASSMSRSFAITTFSALILYHV